MSLYVETRGEGLDIVFLHGWGFNSAIWNQVVDDLVTDYRVTLIDLPGFGRSTGMSYSYEMDVLIDCLGEVIPKKAILFGWSLGGLIAQGFALKYPEHLKKIILLSSNAQFVATDDWPHGMKAAVLDGFVDELVENFKRTLQVFLLLQAQGGDHARETIRQLKLALYAHGNPEAAALRGGLLLLKKTSFVSQLENFTLPVDLICGQRDTIMPLAAGKIMAKKIPNATLHVFEQSAHAPFISHYSEFMKKLKYLASL